jgi:hypothetical protein
MKTFSALGYRCAFSVSLHWSPAKTLSLSVDTASCPNWAAAAPEFLHLWSRLVAEPD